MKALSLSAPYGTLIALAERYPEWGKRIETRGRRTAYRGPLAIHQAQSLRYVGGRSGLVKLLEQDRFFSALARLYPSVFAAAGFMKYLPMGAIVAVCELRECVTTEDIERCSPFDLIGTVGKPIVTYELTDQERAFGDYSAGRWAWLLTNIRALPEPIPCRGRQWLWELDSATEAQIAAQLARPRCPRCGAQHDVAHYVNGDKVWCTKADLWFQVWFRPGGAQLLACDAPPGFPKLTQE